MFTQMKKIDDDYKMFTQMKKIDDDYKMFTQMKTNLFRMTRLSLASGLTFVQSSSWWNEEIKRLSLLSNP